MLGNGSAFMMPATKATPPMKRGAAKRYRKLKTGFI